ncbi:hypothetical protein Tco_0051764, partial [Tanacetum coccineum]
VTELSSPQNTQSPRQVLQKDTQLPQTRVPKPNVADEVVFKERDDRVVRATTIATSLDAAWASGNIPKTQSTTMFNDPLSWEIGLGDRPRCQEAMRGAIAQTKSEKASKHSYDSPLSGVNTLGRGHTSGSDEGRPNINELTAICKNLSNRVLALEQSKTAQDLVIRKLKKKSLDEEHVSKHGRKSDKTKPMFDDSDFAELDVDNAMDNVEGDAKTQGRNTAEQITTAGDTVNTASIDVSAAGPSNVSTADPSTSTVGDIFKDEMMTIADTLVAIRSTPRTTLVIIHDVEEEPRRSTPAPTSQPSSKDKGKSLMVEPKKLSKNPGKAQIQMDEELAIRLHKEEKAELERMQRERAAQEEASNAALITEFDNVQARIEADALLAARLQEKEREQFFIDEQARFLVETTAKRKRSYMKRSRRIKDFIPMDSEEGRNKAASSKKRPRIEPDEKSVKRQKIGETFSEAYQIFADILKKFDRDDLVKLWDFVKKRFSTTKPTNDKEKELWVELKRLFEPNNDDILWNLQIYMHDPLV